MRKSGQYWIKIKWPAAVNGYIWVVALWSDYNSQWVSPQLKRQEDVLGVDENMLVYIESQYRSKEYNWPSGRDVDQDDHSTTAILRATKNIGEILQEIHQQLVISNQKK